jgi:short-subunit dehydrogenase
MQINGARIILTGAASGIGRALLLRFAAYDVQIIAADRDSDRLHEVITTAQGKGKITPFVGDLGQATIVDELIEHSIQARGGIDLFIANAGFAYYEQFASAPDVWTQLDAIYRVNVYSPLYALAKLRQMNRGIPYTVVMTASAQARLPIPGYAVYSSTKAALDAFASAYRYEQPPNEHLIMVYPVSTKTNFFNTASSKIPPTIPPVQAPEQVAAAILRGIERDQREVHPSFPAAFLSSLNPLLPVKWLTQQFAAFRFRRWRNS